MDDEWIDVEDRLPSVDTPVRVLHQTKDGSVSEQTWALATTRGVWYMAPRDGRATGHWFTGRITHWRDAPDGTGADA